MKDDLISRKAACDKMMELYNEDVELYGVPIPEGFDGHRAVEAIKEIPPAEPERQQGKWIEKRAMDDKTFKADKTIWDVGETVKEKKEESPFMIKTCPFRIMEYGNEAFCTYAKCGLWSDVGGACAFVVIASGLYGE